MTQARSQQEYYEIGKNQIQTTVPELTDFNDGSINDIILGTVATLTQEITRLLLDRFKKTYLNSAEGTDLEYLATDHFGDSFARPEAQKAVGVVTFERPNDLAGDCIILEGSIVKTTADANGESERFETLAEVTMTGTSINASVRAITAGVAGNSEATDINVIETALTDATITVENALAMSGGAAEEDDAEYRETIKTLITSIKGSTKAAIEAAAKGVSGIEQATAHEFQTTVIEWDEGGGTPVGTAFEISNVKLYVADVNGVASDALIDLVTTAVDEVRSVGVLIEAISAIASIINWTASITLNPAGPNYATLQTDTTMIVNSMIDYIEDFPIGQDFVRADAEAAMLAIWGAAGTNDLTAYSTTVPSGDITHANNEKAITGTIATG